MNLKTNKINSANVIASGTIALKDLENKIVKIATKLSKTLKIDGFRKGKVPLALVRSRYQDNIKQDAQREAVQDMLQAALKELNIAAQQVIGDPIITRFNENAENIDVEIKISLIPEINLDNIEQCIPEVKLPKITQKDIDARAEDIAKREAPLINAAKTKKLENGDSAVFDFEGFIDNKAFEGGKAENFELVIGSGQFIPGFEDSMLGMKAGEEKDIKVTFPENYQAKHLAGKEAVFKIKLHAIKVRDKVELNDDLAKKFMPQNPEATLKDFMAEVEKQLQFEAKTKLYNEELKEKLVENFLKNILFDLPDLIVEQEMDLLFRNSLGTLSAEELKVIQESVEKAKEKRESFRDDAQKSVRVTFIVDSLAKQKGIVVQDNEVFQTLYYEAMMMGQNPEEVIEYYKNNNLFPAIKMAMIEDRVLHHLLDSKIDSEKKPDSKSEATQKPKKTTKKKEVE
ncbi:trigger factor [Helicobacter sp. faydin-H20]|uniref:trigger factor n=1 Tax=Helicobacter anatolicus TaxID=2905874 RepID=UPI001E40178A|nr:trigger factor [Helicobacter anatolicus]MCE3036290.1 trigger factor [Helicobacter anatolicus]